MKALKRIMFMISLILLGGLAYWAQNSQVFAIEEVRLQIELAPKRNSSTELNEGLVFDQRMQLEEKLKVFKNQSLIKVHLEDVSRLLNEDPWIDQFHVQKIWPNILAVKIHVHTYFAIYRSGNLWFAVNRIGESLPLNDLKTLPDAPFLSGEVFAKNIALRLQAVQFLQQLPRKGRIHFSQISELTHEVRSGFVLHLKNSKVDIQIGKENWPIKVARAEQVLDYLDARQLEARVINTNLSKKVLVRLRKAP